MRFEDDFHDLAPLDPTRDALRWEAMVGSILGEAQPELVRRARTTAPGTLLLLSEWMRPAVSAAALLAAAAGAFLLTEHRSTVSADTEGLADALYPATVATWLEADQTPSLEDLVTATEGYGR